MDGGVDPKVDTLMYLPGQIVYDKDAKAPARIPDDVWDIGLYPKRSTNFIKDGGYKIGVGKIVEIAMPKTIEEAQDLLDRGVIVPAPIANTHCWRCGNWWSNHTPLYWCKETSNETPR